MQCRALWDRVRGQERWGKAWAVQALAAVQRLELSLGAFADSLYSLTQVLTLLPSYLLQTVYTASHRSTC